MDLMDEFKITAKEEMFLQYDSGKYDPEGFLILAI